jgi:hypothetical protein
MVTYQKQIIMILISGADIVIFYNSSSDYEYLTAHVHFLWVIWSIINSGI